MRFLIFLASVYMALTAVAAQEKKIVCYFGSWATYRDGAGKFVVENIDTSLCTHVIYSFVGLGDDNKLTILDAWQDLPDGGGMNGLARFNALKNNNSNLKTLVAIGGWEQGSQRYSQMAASASSRAVFIQSVVAFVKQYNFNGFDVDWEYPTQRGGSSADRENFTALLRELNAALKQEGRLLSAAVVAGEGIASASYNIPEINNYLDFINLMTYDFVVSSESAVGMNAGYDSVDAAVKYWLNSGVSKEKLILGTPMYGHTFTLANNAQNTPGSPAKGPGTAGPYTQAAGMLGYNEICADLNAGGWNVRWDAARQVPYAYKGDQWISYDNVQSIQAKALYANQMGLGGAMIWSIDTDDFRGTCGETYPLLKTLNRVIRGIN